MFAKWRAFYAFFALLNTGIAASTNPLCRYAYASGIVHFDRSPDHIPVTKLLNNHRRAVDDFVSFDKLECRWKYIPNTYQ
jgi:hypothetical protein